MMPPIVHAAKYVGVNNSMPPLDKPGARGTFFWPWLVIFSMELVL